MTDRRTESFAFCRQLTRRTAGNFGYAFWALPAAQRKAMDALYSFMRITDDIGDEPGRDLAERRAQLDRWRGDLESALDGRLPDHPVWPAVVDIVERYQIPAGYLQDVIDGVAMDLSPRRFETFSELATYCYHVAGAVGLCCIRIWGYQGDKAEQRAIDCGVAFQLTNILRDVGEDAAQGRIYLPAEDMRMFGYTAEDLHRRVYNSEFIRLMAFEKERARIYFIRGEQLISDLSPPGRRVFTAMTDIYAQLLCQIERRNYDVFSRRIRLPTWRKVWITGRAMRS
jgi:phytoene synthase